MSSNVQGSLPEWEANQDLQHPSRRNNGNGPSRTVPSTLFFRPRKSDNPNVHMIRDTAKLQTMLSKTEDVLSDSGLVNGLSDQGAGLRRHREEIIQRLKELSITTGEANVMIPPIKSSKGSDENEIEEQLEHLHIDPELTDLDNISDGLKNLDLQQSRKAKNSAHIIQKVIPAGWQNNTKVQPLNIADVIDLEEGRRKQEEMARLLEAKNRLAESLIKFSTHAKMSNFDRMAYRGTPEDSDDSDDESLDGFGVLQ